MKYLMSIILVGSLLVSGFSQTKRDFSDASHSDPEATKVLDKVNKKYQAYKSITATFTLEIEIPEEPIDKQTGVLKQQGDKYYVDFNSYSMISDGKSLWIHNKANEEVQLNDAPDEGEMGDEDFIAPQDFYKFYQSGKYAYALTNAIYEEGKSVLQIEFKPLDDDSEYSKIRMTIEKKTSRVKRVKVFSKDSSRFTLTINELTPNKTFSNSDFVFDKSKFPDVHVEDLRF